MPIAFNGQVIEMEGACTIEEADALLAFLERTPGAKVSLRGCEHLHTALLQILVARRVPLTGEVYSPFLWKWIAPLLARDGEPTW